MPALRILASLSLRLPLLSLKSSAYGTAFYSFVLILVAAYISTKHSRRAEEPYYSGAI